MKFRALLAGAMLAAVFGAEAQAMRISNDKGGQIGPYLDAYVNIRNSGDRVIIDGPCLSACTIVLGIMPRERICVTKRAQLGFHAAWNPGTDGRPVLTEVLDVPLIKNEPRPERGTRACPRGEVSAQPAKQAVRITAPSARPLQIPPAIRVYTPLDPRPVRQHRNRCSPGAGDRTADAARRARPKPGEQSRSRATIGPGPQHVLQQTQEI